MANKGKKNNKLKRKRGKKFRYYEGEDGKMMKQVESNPFEEHSKAKKDIKDNNKVQFILSNLLLEDWSDRRV